MVGAHAGFYDGLRIFQDPGRLLRAMLVLAQHSENEKGRRQGFDTLAAASKYFGQPPVLMCGRSVGLQPAKLDLPLSNLGQDGHPILDA